MINLLKLTNAILSLVPNAKFSIHNDTEESLKNADDGISVLQLRLGKLVVWNPTNIIPCPSDESIQEAYDNIED